MRTLSNDGPVLHDSRSDTNAKGAPTKSRKPNSATSMYKDGLSPTRVTLKRGILRAALAAFAARGALAAPAGQRSSLARWDETPSGLSLPVYPVALGATLSLAPRALSASDAASQVADLQAQIDRVQAEIATADPSDVAALQQTQLDLMQKQNAVMSALQSGGDVSFPTPSAAPTVVISVTPTLPAPTQAPSVIVPAVPTTTTSQTSSSVAPSAAPSELTGPEASQWQAAVQGELTSLFGEAAQAATIAANYAQAGIGASVASALPPTQPQSILNDVLAQKAEQQMQSNYAALGSMDLSQQQIQDVYSPAISAASQKTGVPASIVSSIIWTESKGHPLTANGGLGQIDPVAWGQMVDANPSLQNRYTPADNIMAAAMYLASKAGGNLPTSDDAWLALYHAAYQG